MDSALPQHSFGTGELSLFESIFESLLMDGFSATVYIYIYIQSIQDEWFEK